MRAAQPYWRRRPVWQQRLIVVLAYQAPVLIALGILLLAPLAIAVWDAHGIPPGPLVRGFALPAALAFVAGLLIRYRRPGIVALSQNEALLITTAVWITTGVVGALPFMIALDTPPLHSVFESVSGFTTAGTTMLTGLDALPRSILLWRALTQWFGGLGILLVVLLIGQSRGSRALSLLSAEGVKVSSGRLSFNFSRAATRFTVIYLVLTSSQVMVTLFLGMPLFDSVAHAMTTVSTGGFSPHDQSISFYRAHPDRFPNFVVIELVVMLFMLAGGINFYVLYRLGRGELRALWDVLEMRLLWLVVGGATLIVTASTWLEFGGSAGDWLLKSGFEVVSLVSTTGYETVSTGAFPRLAREVFLILMILGGCAGSTAGGIKLVRLGLLGKFLSHDIRTLRLPPHAVHVPTLDGSAVSETAFRQAVFIVLLWVVYVGVGGIAINWLAPELQPIEAFSTVFSAIGVFGPSFVPVARVIALPSVAKAIFIVGMLAGRLEILPLLVFFNVAAWRQ